jgi:hypothetical protein
MLDIRGSEGGTYSAMQNDFVEVLVFSFLEKSQTQNEIRGAQILIW